MVSGAEVEHGGGKPVALIPDHVAPASTAPPLVSQPVVSPRSFLSHFRREIDYSKYILTICRA